MMPWLPGLDWKGCGWREWAEAEIQRQVHFFFFFLLWERLWESEPLRFVVWYWRALMCCAMCLWWWRMCVCACLPATSSSLHFFFFYLLESPLFLCTGSLLSVLHPPFPVWNSAFLKLPSFCVILQDSPSNYALDCMCLPTIHIHTHTYTNTHTHTHKYTHTHTLPYSSPPYWKGRDGVGVGGGTAGE